MKIQDFFNALQQADTIDGIEKALVDFERDHAGEFAWVPVGHKANNSGVINVATDPGRSLVERLTNAIDGVLEREHETHGGKPDCRSPREAASTWLGIPAEGLSALTPRQRQIHADNVVIGVTPGEDRKESRTIEVRDYGIGITPERMPDTILSLNESNKWQKHYLAGTFGQGGSSTFASSTYTLIASRYNDHPVVGFTVVKYLDLPADLFKTGHYVYLVLNNALLQAEPASKDFSRGTQVKHFGYDLSAYASPLGPNSLYGLLNQTLFDPILPVWLSTRVHNYRRVIKGSRNALNGAIDEGDEESRGPKLSHNVCMFYVTLGEFGQIGVEYWVLERPTKEAKRPTAAFVNPNKPIILTINGQNQEEMTNLLVRKESELPYLTQRLICHVDCNILKPETKRALFSSTREGARRGIIHDLIQKEIVRILRSDDELSRLNEEARKQGAQEMDQNAVQQMRKEVARILQLQGINVGEAGGTEASAGEPTPDKPRHPRPPRPPVTPITLKEPPTFIRIVWDEEGETTFYPEQRRYVRIETDAESRYHKANSDSSPLNIIVSGMNLSLKGTTPLQGGRMRAIFEASSQAKTDESGTIRVELTRPGLYTLFDERKFNFVNTPPARPSENKLTLPPFEVVPVGGPNDSRWLEMGWPDDINTIASSAELEGGKLTIYYSTVFPRFASTVTHLEGRDITKAASFIERYKIWLAVHSFFLYRDQQASAAAETVEQQTDAMINAEAVREREERCRIATLSALFASREVLQMAQNSQEYGEP